MSEKHKKKLRQMVRRSALAIRVEVMTAMLELPFSQRAWMALAILRGKKKGRQ
jgi:hypothetical protein